MSGLRRGRGRVIAWLDQVSPQIICVVIPIHTFIHTDRDYHLPALHTRIRTYICIYINIRIHTESSSITLIEELTRRLKQLESSPSSTAGAADKRSCFYNGSPTAGTGAGAAVLGLNTQVTEAESYDSMDSVGSGRRRRWIISIHLMWLLLGRILMVWKIVWVFAGQVENGTGLVRLKSRVHDLTSKTSPFSWPVQRSGITHGFPMTTVYKLSKLLSHICTCKLCYM